MIIMRRSCCQPREWMVKSPFSFWEVLTVVRRISSRIIWHSLMIDVKIVCIICISVDKILRLCEHELIPKWFWPLTKVVIFSSPSKVVREMLPHKRISVKISPLQASLYHFAPRVSVTLPGQFRLWSLLHGSVSVSLCHDWGGQFAADTAPRLIIVTTLAVPDITTLRGDN